MGSNSKNSSASQGKTGDWALFSFRNDMSS